MSSSHRERAKKKRSVNSAYNPYIEKSIHSAHAGFPPKEKAEKETRVAECNHLFLVLGTLVTRVHTFVNILTYRLFLSPDRAKTCVG